MKQILHLMAFGLVTVAMTGCATHQACNDSGRTRTAYVVPAENTLASAQPGWTLQMPSDNP